MVRCHSNRPLVDVSSLFTPLLLMPRPKNNGLKGASCAIIGSDDGTLRSLEWKHSSSCWQRATCMQSITELIPDVAMPMMTFELRWVGDPPVFDLLLCRHAGPEVLLRRDVLDGNVLWQKPSTISSSLSKGANRVVLRGGTCCRSTLAAYSVVYKCEWLRSERHRP
jgi:hypothetical protein